MEERRGGGRGRRKDIKGTDAILSCRRTKYDQVLYSSNVGGLDGS